MSLEFRAMAGEWEIRIRDFQKVTLDLPGPSKPIRVEPVEEPGRRPVELPDEPGQKPEVAPEREREPVEVPA